MYNKEKKLHALKHENEPKQEFGGTVRPSITSEDRGEYIIQIASQTAPNGLPIGRGNNAVPLLAEVPVMAIAEEVVPQRRSVKESLKNRVHEARIA